jgi:MOSC domain-containing protein YiiM
VNIKTHRHLRLRGLNAKVIEPGTVASGDTIRKL